MRRCPCHARADRTSRRGWCSHIGGHPQTAITSGHQDLQLQPEGPGSALRLPDRERVAGLCRILEHRHPGDLRDDLFEHLQLLAHQLWANGGKSSDVTAGPSQAGDEALGHRVA